MNARPPEPLDPAKLAEAVCIEHLIPCRRRFTHNELADYIMLVRETDARPVAAESCTDINEGSYP